MVNPAVIELERGGGDLENPIENGTDFEVVLEDNNHNNTCTECNCKRGLRGGGSETDSYSNNDTCTCISVIDIPSMLPNNGEKSEFSLSPKRRHSSLRQEPSKLLYGIEDNPPWYFCLFVGFQHYLEMIGATIACPFILTPALCMDNDDPNKANIISTLIFMSGIITLLQSTVGCRLPIIQGGSFSYLVPSLAILSLPQWKCPSASETAEMSYEEKTELWQVRMREIQGAIIFAALFQIIFAVTGFISWLVKYITPLTIAPAITLIGLSLFKNVTEQCAKNYYVSFGTILLLIICSQHLRKVKIPTPFAQKSPETGERERFPLFQVFPVLIAIGLMWAICGILTATDVFPVGDMARTDAKIKILDGAPWFRIPYPFQWGWPTVSVGAVAGMFCGVLTTTIESLGDYFACATVSGANVPPPHVLNRGILIESVGCFLSGFWGSGNGSTSYSNNIGTITVTKVASRRVIQFAGLIMIALSLVGKAGAIFVGLPDPLLGGMFCYIFPLIMAVGIGTLAEVNLESSRNIFIISFSIFGGLAISQWMETNPGMIKTGSLEGDNLIQILLSTGMFVAGLIGFILDNTISGTKEERGLIGRAEAKANAKIERDTSYDLPLVMGIINKLTFLRWLPISPTYEKHLITHLWKKITKKR